MLRTAPPSEISGLDRLPGGMRILDTMPAVPLVGPWPLTRLLRHSQNPPHPSLTPALMFATLVEVRTTFSLNEPADRYVAAQMHWALKHERASSNLNAGSGSHRFLSRGEGSGLRPYRPQTARSRFGARAPSGHMRCPVKRAGRSRRVRCSRLGRDRLWRLSAERRLHRRSQRGWISDRRRIRRPGPQVEDRLAVRAADQSFRGGCVSAMSVTGMRPCP